MLGFVATTLFVMGLGYAVGNLCIWFTFSEPSV